MSHVPHLTAAALMVVAEGHARGQPGPLLRLAAGGFRDMTRIAAGTTGIWPDVCADNAEAITTVLDELIGAADPRSATSWPAAARDELVVTARTGPRGAPQACRAASPGPAGEVVELRIPVPNREGVLADVTTLATRLGVNIEALETADATEHERGLIVMVVAADGAAGASATRSCERGYRPVVRAVE